MHTNTRSGRCDVADQQRAALARGDVRPAGDGARHARGDLRARVQRAAHALQVALDGVVGDAN